MFPLSQVFRSLGAARNFLYDRGILRSTRFEATTVSVGNLVVGGTGKSPVVMDLAGAAARQHWFPMVVTRGYGGKLSGREFLVLENEKVKLGNKPLDDASDEARMYAARLRNIPIIVGKHRVNAVREYLRAFPPPVGARLLLILDDGFQHRAFARDLDIVIVDHERPFGSGELLPLGILREPAENLRRADIILCSSCNAASHTLFPPGTTVKSITFETTMNAADQVRAKNGPVVFATSIARPERALTGIKTLGIAPVATFFFPDHSRFDYAAMAPALQNAPRVLLTEKDFFRERAALEERGVEVLQASVQTVWDRDYVLEVIS